MWGSFFCSAVLGLSVVPAVASFVIVLCLHSHRIYLDGVRDVAAMSILCVSLTLH